MKIPVFCFGISLMCTSVFADPMTFRAASWNINNLNAVSKEPLRSGAPVRIDDDYEILKSYADAMEADIIALQEMGSPEAVRRIFPQDEWELVFSSRYNSQNEPDIYTAIVVRKNKATLVKGDTVQSLAIKDGSYSTRAGVEALVEINGQEFWILAVHLKSGCFAGSLTNPRTDACIIASQQIAPLEEWIDEKETTGLPVLVMGDFNRKFDIHKQRDHIWGEIDDAVPPTLNLTRLPFDNSSNCPTTRIRDREYPIDFIVMNALAWELVDQQSFTEHLYFDDDAETLGRRLSDHCPVSVDLVVR